MPFLNHYHRDSHFIKHGHEFGAIDALHYERMADQFMFGPMNVDTRECTRAHTLAGAGDRLRGEMVVRHFGVVGNDPNKPEFLRSFYIPKASILYRHGGMVGYFASECGRIMV